MTLLLSSVYVYWYCLLLVVVGFVVVKAWGGSVAQGQLSTDPAEFVVVATGIVAPLLHIHTAPFWPLSGSSKVQQGGAVAIADEVDEVTDGRPPGNMLACLSAENSCPLTCCSISFAQPRNICPFSIDSWCGIQFFPDSRTRFWTTCLASAVPCKWAILDDADTIQSFRDASRRRGWVPSKKVFIANIRTDSDRVWSNVLSESCCQGRDLVAIHLFLLLWC
jgi:hypothetical protein